jgi:hypothetical protein
MLENVFLSSACTEAVKLYCGIVFDDYINLRGDLWGEE